MGSSRFLPIAAFWIFTTCSTSGQLGRKEWWRNAAVYQIYPPSLRDSDNDGRGDLKGIIEKIPYLKETGFKAVWLSPIYTSPMVDFGYDISDYRNVHEWYGSMDDFDELVDAVHDSDMKLIMDFVPNHSSDKHNWFLRSSNGEPEYVDYYVWKDPKGFDENGIPIPPNNWLSVFYGPAWTYHEGRRQFYLHQFASAQPDLNYRNPKVVQEMEDVILFWLRKGVDGFRIDAAPFLFEDPSFRDEPVASTGGADPLSHGYLEHIHTQNLPETLEMVQQWRELIDKENAADGRDRCFMIEAYASVMDTMKYFGTKERPGGHFPFNFFLMDTSNRSTASEIKGNIEKWMGNLPEFGHSNWVIGNHDQHRIGSKVGEDLIDGMNMIALLLPGTSVTYYGEEIGMLNNDDIVYEDGIDPQGCNYPQEEFKSRSRDFERTPFQWDGTTNAGFNTGAKPWLPVNKNYKKLNLEAQKDEPYSHYTIFTDIMRARNMSAVRDGNLSLQIVGKGTLGFVRALNSDDFVVVLINFSHSDDSGVDLDAEFLLGKKQLTVYTTDSHSGYRKGEKVNIADMKLAKRSALVLTP